MKKLLPPFGLKWLVGGAIGLVLLLLLAVADRAPETSAQPAQNYPLAHVTICKQTDPPDPQGFSFTWSDFTGLPNPFGLKHNGCFEIDLSALFSPYTFTELQPPGWQLVNINCTADPNIVIGSDSVVMNLQANENVTCTFFNCQMLDQNGDTIVDACTAPCAAPGNLVVNPSFEMVGPELLGLAFGSVSDPGHPLGIAQVPDWRAGPGIPIGGNALTPDILTPNPSNYVPGANFYGSPPYVPANFMGNQTAFDGNNYAGISAGLFQGTYLAEELIGKLTSATTLGGTYLVAARMSQGETRDSPVDMEISLRDSNTNTTLLGVVGGHVANTAGWDYINVGGVLSQTQTFDEVIIRGVNTHGHGGGYVYIDCVLVVPVPAVGGITELRADGGVPSALAAGGSGGLAEQYAAIAGGLAAGVLALAAGAWYAQRRFRQRRSHL